MLDTDYFDGVSPRNWGKKLEKYVRDRTKKSTFIMPVFDENGNKQMLEFARHNELIQNNSGNSKRVLNKILRTNDNISKLAVLHIDEIVSVSNENDPYYTKGENKYQWLDKNGWLHRNAVVQNNKSGALYQVNFDIAKTEDGRLVLYATNGNIRKLGQAAVNSQSINDRGSQATYRVNNNNVPQTEEIVKRKFSKNNYSEGDHEYMLLSSKAGKANISYNYEKSFSEQIDDFKKGKIPRNNTLLVSGTPEVWQKVGMNALPVTINKQHINYALYNTKDADHYLGETALKQLPEAIKDPVAIMQSVTHPDRAVVVLAMNHNGKKVFTAIEVDGTGRLNDKRIDSNAVTTIFAKKGITNQLYDNLTDTINGGNKLFYWNKKEAISLLQRAGLQLPGRLPQDGFINSIRNNRSNVNTKFKNVTQTQQFKRWFGEWEKNPQKASKVVNEDGTPKVVSFQRK